MIREIVKDPILLSRKSAMATKEDITIADDLKDTLTANIDRCVGMGANMIGEYKNIIVFSDNGTLVEMFNPIILKGEGRYECEEGCLSLEGVRKTKRFKKIKVKWQTRDFQVRIKTYEGFSAQIIQHEIDHCQGVLI